MEQSGGGRPALERERAGHLDLLDLEADEQRHTLLGREVHGLFCVNRPDLCAKA